MTDTTSDADALVTTHASDVWNSRTCTTNAESDAQSTGTRGAQIPYGGTG